MHTASRTTFASLAMLCGLGLLVVACPASLDDRCADGACVRSADGGFDADVGIDAAPDPCLDAATVTCLDESSALFVSGANGNDQDPLAGTKPKPFRTIGAAIKKIDAAHKRVYVCEGAYFEDVSLSSTHNGVSILGGVDCAWNPTAGKKPVIGASANPFKIQGAVGVALGDLSVIAKDATTGSSVALFIDGGDVTLKRVAIVAGLGQIGAPGALIELPYPDPSLLKGNDTTDANGAGQAAFTCPGPAPNATVGGRGGDSAARGDKGSPGPLDNRGAISPCNMMGSGGDGAIGVNGPDGRAGAALGTLTPTGWAPASGAPGSRGAPGQGGGGGYGSGGGGGSGGAGGCGGAGGGGGEGGGASIGIAALTAKLTIVESSIEAKRGGEGGPGVLGQQGQTVGGTRGSGGVGCDGGPGGPGGSGGAGAGGAGGLSVAVLFKGEKPGADAMTTLKFGMPQKGGNGAAGNNGEPGAADRFLEAK